MALALTVTKHYSDGKKIHIFGTVAASGNYAANGDTISFADPAIKSTKVPEYVELHGTVDYAYSYIPGASKNVGKIKVMVMSTGAEVGAGAYPAAVIADVISIHAIFPQLV